MGKDFRVGLMTGVVLAGAALVWVATRPSLSPQAQIAPAGAASSEAGRASDKPLPWENADAVEVVPSDPFNPSGASGPQGIAERPASEEPQRPQEPPVFEPAPQPGLPDLTIHELNEPIKTTRFHIVRKGENLSTIAQQYYGSQDKWRKIVTTNQKIIKDPNKIAPGTKLIIPD